MFDGQFLGFVALGANVYFRSTSGKDLHVCTVPEDVDSHALVDALNSVSNIVMELTRSHSDYKF